MKWHIEKVKVPQFGVEEWSKLPLDQQNRVQELKRKLIQYKAMLNTLRLKLKK